ncbi:hypothetical protein GCM10027610_141530 [Dactylosporangium cerinum]
MRNRAVTAAMLTHPLSVEVPDDSPPATAAAQAIYREAMTSAIAAITPSAVRVGA